MKVLHVVPTLDPEHGGPVEVVVGLTNALVKQGIDVSVFATVSKKKAGISIGNFKDVEVKSFPVDLLSKVWSFHSPSLAKVLMREVSNFDLIHIHEIWHHPHFAAYKASKFARKHFIITIHGTLEPWCLNYKAVKKRIYSTIIQRKILKEASGLHAITEEEVRNISNLVDNKNVFIIPNGLNLEEFENLPYREWLEDLYPEMKWKKVILFLGRIHPKKGLDILAKAFRTILKKKIDDIQLLIVGPDNDGYKNQIVEILKAGDAIGNTTFTGILTGNDKLAALSRADIFVLPSYSEGFSISTLEAMACELPVVITKQCNFPEVEKIRAGKVIDADVDHLSEALIELLDNTELCKEMGSSGKRLVMEKYSWDKVAERMIAAYEEIIGGRNVEMEAK